MDPRPGTSWQLDSDSEDLDDVEYHLPRQKKNTNSRRFFRWFWWRREDELENYRPEPRGPEEPESSDDEVDFMLLHNSSIDSDAPLTEYADRVRPHKAESTPESSWKRLISKFLSSILKMTHKFNMF